MNTFKTRGSVLKINKAKDKNFIYTVYSTDYGKIICQKKISSKERTIDLGYIINFEIEVSKNKDIHKIRNIKISSEFKSDNKSFEIINNYLELLNLILKECPFGIPNIGIFNIIEKINNYEKINFDKILLAKLKVLDINGILKIENEDKTIQKILNFINKNNIDTIFRLNLNNEEIRGRLEKVAKIP